MKKLILVISIITTVAVSQAQTIPMALQVAKMLPTFQFGVKTGTNLTRLSTSGTLNSDNQAGYLGGFWARIGGSGIQLQPEIYITGKNVTLKDASGQDNTVKFTSIDVPILAGKSFGALGFGGHINTGPVISFVVNKNQSLSTAYDHITHFEYKDQALAWQIGGGIDVQKLTVDLRYEIGLNSLSKDGYPDTKISMFNLSFGYRLF